MAKKKQVDLIPTAQDIPLLIRVRNSEFTKSTKLCDFALKTGIAPSKSPFYARMDKLITGGLVEVVEDLPGKYRIYAIAKTGLQRLEDQHHCLLSLTPNSDVLPRLDQMEHALLLNEIRERWEADLGAEKWMTSLEVRDVNLNPECDSFAKDYDAVFWLPRTKWNKPPLRVALEYERTLKSPASRYSKIAEKLEQERLVSFVLYACDSRRKIMPIMDLMRTGNVAFTTAHAILKEGLNSPSFIWDGQNIRLFPVGHLVACA